MVLIFLTLKSLPVLANYGIDPLGDIDSQSIYLIELRIEGIDPKIFPWVYGLIVINSGYPKEFLETYFVLWYLFINFLVFFSNPRVEAKSEF